MAVQEFDEKTKTTTNSEVSDIGGVNVLIEQIKKHNILFICCIVGVISVGVIAKQIFKKDDNVNKKASLAKNREVKKPSKIQHSNRKFPKKKKIAVKKVKKKTKKLKKKALRRTSRSIASLKNKKNKRLLRRKRNKKKWY